MLRVTKFTDYALIVLCCFVNNSNQDNVMSAAVIARTVNLKLPTVSKILKTLVKSGLVKSYRGSEGGYCLAKDPSNISISEVVASLEGPVTLTDCMKLNSQRSCEHIEACELKQPWNKINNKINEIFDNISIQDLAKNKIEI